jgi:hypothetical protein
MNCCDEYGNCHQGRDCPARVAERARIERIRKLAREHRSRDDILEVLAPLAMAALILLAIWIGSIYHDAVRTVS